MTQFAGREAEPPADPDAQAGQQAARDAMNARPVRDRYTPAFATAAIAELGRLMADLPAKIRDSVSGGRDAAEALNPDPLQGLAEVVQNADDQQASTVRIGLVDGVSAPRLVVVHDGGRLQLEHLLAMVLPWVSTKRDDARTTGRFGIGLSTLRSIGDSLEIHCAPYHAELVNGRLRPIPAAEPLPGLYDADPDRPATMVVVPVRPGVQLSSATIRDWLTTWGSAALLFLGSVREVQLIDPSGGDEPLALSLARTASRTRSLTVSDGELPVLVSEVSDPASGARWIRYDAELPVPRNVFRARKKTGATTPLSLAVPLHPSPVTGLVHAGLPLVATGLPWSMNAQLDPDAARGHVRNTAWNRAVIDLLAQFWAAVADDLLRTRPSTAWQAVPLEAEVSCPGDPWLADALHDALIVRGRAALTSRSAVRVAERPVPLDQLAYPDPALQDLVSDDDVRTLAPDRVVLERDARSADARWWSVLRELRVGAAIEIQAALHLMTGTAVDHRTPQWFIDMSASAIAGGAADALAATPCVVLRDGRCVRPPLPGDDPRVLLAADAPESLLDRAGLVHRVHAAYSGDGDEARSVVRWLEGLGAYVAAPEPAALAISRVARARPGSLPLGDPELVAFRDLYATLAIGQQEAHGHDIGAVLVIDAESWDEAEQPVRAARPAGSCYQPRSIDRDPDGWPVAARKTPDLWWAASRYGQVLRSEAGRSGLGAQRFFTLLGVERVPRLADHPAGERKYNTDRRTGVSVHAYDATPTRRDEVRHVPGEWTHVLEDTVSPDLDRVLAAISSDRSSEQRRRRAAALLATLQRGWDRMYAPRAQAPVVLAHHQWNPVGATVTSWWLARLRDEAWLPDTKGRPRAPRELVLPSPANRVVYGSDGHYVDRALVAGLREDVVAALGITGDPRVSDVVDVLRSIRDTAPAVTVEGSAEAWGEAAAQAYPMYQILADWLTPNRRRRMDVATTALRRTFAAGAGLVLTDQGWRTPAQVFSGPPVFGSFRSFAPFDASLERLWKELEVRRPAVEDCAAVLREIGGRVRRPGDETVELETLRLLDGLLEGASAPTGLRRLPVATSGGRSGKRPVYALEDPMLAEALAEHAAVWVPGGDVRQFSHLFEALNITRVTAKAFSVADGDAASEDATASAVARAALSLLLDELARDDPALAASATDAATTVADLRVVRHEDLRLRVRLPAGEVVLGARSYLDASSCLLHVHQDEDVADWAIGGRAIASLFDGDRRKVAYAWAAMWSRAEAGERRRAMVLAEQEATVRSAALLHLRGDIESERGAPAQARRSPGRQSGVTTREVSALPPRVLIDPSELSPAVPAGTIVNPDGRAAPARGKGGSVLREPSAGKRGTGRGKATPPASYTDKDREDVGLEILRRLLEGGGEELQDVRQQVLVGADATDTSQRFYELKVHGGPAPNTVSMQASEIDRARDPNFFLVVVSNVEDGAGTPEVRIIADPLHRLAGLDDGSVTFSGVHEAEALVYELPLEAPAE
ncbi:sacsin N-terminal ATP-binding-like domain-containing protein [Modestobacter lapidis]